MNKMVAKLQSMAYSGFMANILPRVWISVVVGFRIRNRDGLFMTIRGWPLGGRRPDSP